METKIWFTSSKYYKLKGLYLMKTPVNLRMETKIWFKSSKYDKLN